MMTWETLRDLIRDEWFILGLLFLWSLAGLTIICERIYTLWNIVPRSERLKERVLAALDEKDLAKARALSETSNEPLAEIFDKTLKTHARYPHKIVETATSQRLFVVASLKRNLWALGTVGSSAPFVGLFGTVVGILKAFQSMAAAGTGGFKVVAAGIAAALVATAGGLFVAIYAVIAYNYFVARVGAIGVQYKLYCEEFLLALSELDKQTAGGSENGAGRKAEAGAQEPAGSATRPAAQGTA